MNAALRHHRQAARDIGIEALLQWTFGAQRARTDEPDDPWNGRQGRSPEAVIFERGAVLGCSIDGGKGFLPDPVHDDAETVATVVSACLTGPHVGMVLACARSGLRPDWMPGAEPRVKAAVDPVTRQPPKVRRDPVDGKLRTVGEIVSRRDWPSGWVGELYEWSGYRRKRFLSRVTPISYQPTRQQIDAARRTYGEWWNSLDLIRGRLGEPGLLRDHRITGAMPVREPWAC